MANISWTEIVLPLLDVFVPSFVWPAEENMLVFFLNGFFSS
jgi:hypothetical protein